MSWKASSCSSIFSGVLGVFGTKDAKHIGAYACAMDCGGRTFRRHFAIKHIFIQIAPDLAAGSERCRPGQVTF